MRSKKRARIHKIGKHDPIELVATPCIDGCDLRGTSRTVGVNLYQRKVGAQYWTPYGTATLPKSMFSESFLNGLGTLPMDWKKKDPPIHPTHRMTTWKTDIRCPASTPRFYRVRHCKKCEIEEMKHPAGHFNRDKLAEECKG